MRTTFENLLRGWWKEEGGKITYAGRREAGLAKRNETVRLTYPDGFWIEFEFGARDGMPAKIIYKRMRRDPDSGDQVETTEEEHFMRFVEVNGIQAPWIIDRFVNGKQSARISEIVNKTDGNLRRAVFEVAVEALADDGLHVQIRRPAHHFNRAVDYFLRLFVNRGRLVRTGCLR